MNLLEKRRTADDNLVVIGPHFCDGPLIAAFLDNVTTSPVSFMWLKTFEVGKTEG